MPLSRLENFLKNTEGNIIYVNPNDFDASDSISNRGNSLTRPFKTIQRALIEAARFSYVTGTNNDKFDRTTIMLSPGEHIVDNRPGLALRNNSGTAQYVAKDGTPVTFNEFDETSNLDIEDSSNVLYLLNSIDGGIILPRGTSIVGQDLRKTKIRPLYVPDPTDSNEVSSAIFKITGGCYISTFTVFDSDSTRQNTYKSGTSTTKHVPLFSHHKLTVFEYADGVTKKTVTISGSDVETNLTDLEMYYFKIAKVYGTASNRSIGDYPSTTDIQPQIDEYRIVGNLIADDLVISTLIAGDGVSGSPTITVTTTTDHGLFKDSTVFIKGVAGASASLYNGSFVVTDVINSTQFKYVAASTPGDISVSSANLANARVVIEPDTVSSASPYIFNVSMRSVYGMSGMHADGSKATGFRSMVVAQFTGISLQKDDNAFLKYNTSTDTYENQSALGTTTFLHFDSNSVYNPDYYNYHIKSSNDSFIQSVSVFSIGFAEQFISTSGGDQSVTNSNSSFGSRSLVSSGFKKESFNKDDVGYITHIIPPREIQDSEKNIFWVKLNSSKINTLAGAGSTTRLYIQDSSDSTILPDYNIESYKIGAKINDKIYIDINQVTYSADIIMSGTGVAGTSVSRSEKVFNVSSISSNQITFSANHDLSDGEKVIIFSENGLMPYGLDNNVIYYAKTVSGQPAKIELSKSLNAESIVISSTIPTSTKLRVVSRVTDKIPGDPGHPIQYDTNQSSWYLNVLSGSSLVTAIKSNSSIFGQSSPTTYAKRTSDSRALTDRIYKLRYVVPKEFTDARAPQDGFIIQETKTTGISSEAQESDDATALSSSIKLRDLKIIKSATWSSNVATLETELPHSFITGDKVLISKVKSTNNTSGLIDKGYNGYYTVTVVDTKKFTYSLTTDPGTFANNITVRDSDLPVVSRNEYKNTFSIYRTETLKEHIPSKQDGVYHLILVNNSSKPEANQFSSLEFPQKITNLYPQQDRDNQNSDPSSAVSSAVNYPLGTVAVNDPRNSITKELVETYISNNSIGIAVSTLTSVGTAVTVTTTQPHGLSGISTVSVQTVGAGYSVGRNYKLNNVSSGGEGGIIQLTSVTGGGGIQISGIRVTDSGSGYKVGDVVSVQGGTSTAELVVQSVLHGTNSTIQLSGIQTTGYNRTNNGYNGVYRLTSITNSRTFQYTTDSGLGTGSYSAGGIVLLCGNAIGITSIRYNATSGIATVSTGSTTHGLYAGNKVKITESSSFFNGSFIVKEIVGLSTFTAYVGTGIGSTYAGSGYILSNYIDAYNSEISSNDESLSSRQISIYDRKTTYLANSVTSNATSITVQNISNFAKGDYIEIDDEILRIKEFPSSTTINVFRGVLGSSSKSHDSGKEVRRIKVIPSEIRRTSFIRASGHTFEYVGFGPGNYSTGLPQRQTRTLTKDEQNLSQKQQNKGGIVVYTGMNSFGDFYIGNKRLSSNTAQEETLDSPVITYYGEESPDRLLSGTYDDLIVRQRIKVEGGSTGKIKSEFYGPVEFTSKITSTNDIEVKNLYLVGNVGSPKLRTIGISTPTDSANSGDVVDRSDVTSGSYKGWIYASNGWRRYGFISTDRDSFSISVDKIGIGTDSSFYTIENINGSIGTKSLDTNRLLVTGIATFQNVTNFADVSIGNLTVAVGSGQSVGVGTSTVTTGLKLQINSSSNPVAITTTSRIGVGTTNPTSNVDIRGTLNVTGISTFANATVGFATITNSYTGLATVGVATISNGYVGLATVGFATVTNSYTGLATVGFATITNGYVGVVTISTISLDNNTIITTGVTTTATTSISTIDSFDKSIYNTAQYFVKVSFGSTIHCTNINVISNGTDTFAVEYGVVSTGAGTSTLATFTSDISGANVRLRATPHQSGITTFKVVRTIIN